MEHRQGLRASTSFFGGTPGNERATRNARLGGLPSRAHRASAAAPARRGSAPALPSLQTALAKRVRISTLTRTQTRFHVPAPPTTCSLRAASGAIGVICVTRRGLRLENGVRIRTRFFNREAVPGKSSARLVVESKACPSQMKNGVRIHALRDPRRGRTREVRCWTARAPSQMKNSIFREVPLPRRGERRGQGSFTPAGSL